MESPRQSIILAADLPDHTRIEGRDPSRARSIAATLHGAVSECVYAHGGTVSDTIGSIVIAELTDPSEALRCLEALKARAAGDLARESSLTPRAVLTSGEVREKGFSLTGQAVQNALAILDSLRRNQLLVSSEIVEASGRALSGAPLLRLGEVGYFEVPLAAPAPVAPPASGEPSEGEPVSDEAMETAPARHRSRLPLVAVVGVLVLLAAAAAYFFLFGRTRPAPPVTPAPAPAAIAEPEDSIVRVTVGGFTVGPESEVPPEELADLEPLVASLLSALDLVEISGNAPNRIGAEVRLLPPANAPAEAAEPDAAGAQVLTPLGSETELVPRVVPWVERSGERFEGPDVPYEGTWSVVEATIAWASAQLGFSAGDALPRSPGLRQAYRAVISPSRPAGADPYAALYDAMREEPEFLAGWLALADAEAGDPELDPAILEALRNVSRLEPGRLDLARDLGRRELAAGTLAGAIEAYGRIIAADPGDDEAQRVHALAALASHQPELFRRAAAESADPRIHPADIEVAEGKIDTAVRKYYETEMVEKDNPWLAFKIGRIAVLRRSAQIAELEMERLIALGAEPQTSLLRAYMAAEAGDAATAGSALGDALKEAGWSDSPWFHAAEVYAILRDSDKALQAIERSVDRREPMMHAVTTNPLFGYLANETRFREAVGSLLVHQNNIREALGRQ